jgi:hypothetical protein
MKNFHDVVLNFIGLDFQKLAAMLANIPFRLGGIKSVKRWAAKRCPDEFSITAT